MLTRRRPSARGDRDPREELDELGLGEGLLPDPRAALVAPAAPLGVELVRVHAAAVGDVYADGGHVVSHGPDHPPADPGEHENINTLLAVLIDGEAHGVVFLDHPVPVARAATGTDGQGDDLTVTPHVLRRGRIRMVFARRQFPGFNFHLVTSLTYTHMIQFWITQTGTVLSLVLLVLHVSFWFCPPT